MYQDLVHKGIIVPQPEVPPPPVPMDYAWAREVRTVRGKKKQTKDYDRKGQYSERARTISRGS